VKNSNFKTVLLFSFTCFFTLICSALLRRTGVPIGNIFAVLIEFYISLLLQNSLGCLSTDGIAVLSKYSSICIYLKHTVVNWLTSSREF
jgi:hypothetical protein